MWLGGEQLTSRFLDCKGPAAGRAAQQWLMQWAIPGPLGASRPRLAGAWAWEPVENLDPSSRVGQCTRNRQLWNPHSLWTWGIRGPGFCKGLGHHQAPPTRSVSRELEILYRADVKFEGWLYLILSYLLFPLIFWLCRPSKPDVQAPFGLALSPF